jgi:hypothetical protein
MYNLAFYGDRSVTFRLVLKTLRNVGHEIHTDKADRLRIFYVINKPDVIYIILADLKSYYYYLF